MPRVRPAYFGHLAGNWTCLTCVLEKTSVRNESETHGPRTLQARRTKEASDGGGVIRRDAIAAVVIMMALGAASYVLAPWIGLAAPPSSRSGGDLTFPEMRQFLAAGPWIVVDAAGNDPSSAKLPGALRVAPETLEGITDVVARASGSTGPVIVYGKDASDSNVDGLAEVLRQMGVKDVQIYRGGIEEWSQYGGTLE